VPHDLFAIRWLARDHLSFVTNGKGTPLQQIDVATGAVTTIGTIPDGWPSDDFAHVLNERDDGTVYDQDVATGHIRDLGHVANHLTPILYSPDGRLVMGDVYGNPEGGDDYDIIDVATKHTTRFVLPLDNRVTGVRSEHWLDDRHVIVTAENGLDAGEGLWSFDATDPSAAPEQILVAPPDTSYTVESIVGERAVGTRSTIGVVLTWLDGATIPTPSGTLEIGGITRDKRIVLRRRLDVGWITPGGEYKRVGEYGSIAASGDRVLVADRRAIAEVDAELHVKTLAPVPAGWTNTHLSCAPAPGDRCVVWSRMGTTTEVRALDDLSRPIRFGTNSTFWTLALSADGRRVVVSDRDHFELVDLATGHVDILGLPEPGCWPLGVTWHGQSYVAAIGCPDGEREWEVPPTGAPSRLGATPDEHLSLAIDADGRVLRLLQHWDASLVIYDGI
jgi:hypothetical protein